MGFCVCIRLSKQTMKQTLPLLTILLFFACEPTQKKGIETTVPPADSTAVKVDTGLFETKRDVPPPPLTYQFPYDLSKPNGNFKLSNRLTEISGLSLSPDGQELVAVNDEQGKIFYLNKKNGEIEREVKFGKAGDYEGIESVGDKIYVVKHNGDIYKVKDLDKDKPEAKEYSTKLDSKYDVEGLAYDAAHNRLLLVCKGKAGDGKDMKGVRAVYGFDLEENKLDKEPAYTVDREKIKDHFKSNNVSQRLIDVFTPEYASDAFGPSGIAIHPKTSDICIISSVGKLLVILSPSGEIKYMEKLDASIFKQPEGICFDTDGTLYISTEGKGGRGRLFRFSQN